MNWLNNRVLDWARSWWAILAVFIGFQVSFQALFVIGDWFAGTTAGFQPFDLQNPLALEQVRQQLPAYTNESRSIYRLFILADTIFPPLATLFFSLVFARSLQSIGSRWAERWLSSGIVLLPCVVAVLDWVENVCFALTIWLYPQDVTLWATLAIGLKTTKIAFSVVCNPVVIALAMYAIGRWLLSRLRSWPLRSNSRSGR